MLPHRRSQAINIYCPFCVLELSLLEPVNNKHRVLWNYPKDCCLNHFHTMPCLCAVTHRGKNLVF